MKKPDIKTVLISVVILISFGAVISGLFMASTGVSILGMAVDYGKDIGGRSMEFTNCTMGELCSPTNITYTNPEVHTETDYLIRMNFYTTMISTGYQILWAASVQVLSGVVAGILAIVIYEKKVDI